LCSIPLHRVIQLVSYLSQLLPRRHIFSRNNTIFWDVTPCGFSSTEVLEEQIASVPLKCQFLQQPRDLTFNEMEFFTVTALKNISSVSNLLNCAMLKSNHNHHAVIHTQRYILWHSSNRKVKIVTQPDLYSLSAQKHFECRELIFTFLPIMQLKQCNVIFLHPVARSITQSFSSPVFVRHF
jgi:hypothetical protein